MKRERTAFADRLREALERAGVEPSPAVLEKLLARHGSIAVTAQAISGWLGGKHMPKQDSLRALARICGIEPHILQYGGRLSHGVREGDIWPERLTAQDRLTFEDYLTLTPQQREVVREMIRTLVAAGKRRGE